MRSTYGHFVYDSKVCGIGNLGGGEGKKLVEKKQINLEYGFCNKFYRIWSDLPVSRQIPIV